MQIFATPNMTTPELHVQKRMIFAPFEKHKVDTMCVHSIIMTFLWKNKRRNDKSAYRIYRVR